ncbi:MAG: ABC transporter substrate-binding protein [Candidatus Omnitrophica bacterium]|nr:ABC transporter substrate-binding protein [Candidatus Omnitrophota bacterium]
MSSRRVFVAALLLAALGEVSVPSPGCASQELTVAIVWSESLAPYKAAVGAFQDEFRRNRYRLKPRFIDLNAGETDTATLVRRINELNPALILAVGTQAAQVVGKNIRDIPVVFSMVLDPVETGIVQTWDAPGGNITGVCLKIPAAVQFRRLKEVLPGLRRVGMLYDGNASSGLRDEAEKAARSMGLELVAQPVYAYDEVVDALDILLRDVGCLWAITDSLIYTPASAKHILLTTLREKIPVMAFSAAYVKAGALVAVECDYGDIGRQTARLAVEVARGKEPGTLPVALSGKTLLFLNKGVAEVLGIAIPNSVLRQADEVY